MNPSVPECRTLEPESATAFYIPFYARLAKGRYLWTNYTFQGRDRDCKMLLRWITEQPYWKRSNGCDHFITLGRITWDFRRWEDKEWGSAFLNMPAMQNVTRLLIERNPWDHLHIDVPHPTGFNPRSDADMFLWQNYVRTCNRRTLFSFVGATRGPVRNHFRGLLLSLCHREPEFCRVVDCTGTRSHQRELGDS